MQAIKAIPGAVRAIPGVVRAIPGAIRAVPGALGAAGRGVASFLVRHVGIPGVGTGGIGFGKIAQGARGVVRGAENMRRFGSFNEARAAAKQMAGLGDDAVKYVSELGPMRGQVAGSASPDGLRGWRIDFDPDPAKGFHVNWRDKTGGKARSTWSYGANVIEGGTEKDFLELQQHFQ